MSRQFTQDWMLHPPGGVFAFRLNREAEMVAVTLRDDQERAKGRVKVDAVSRLKGASKWGERA